MVISKEIKDDIKEFSIVMSFTISLLALALMFVFFIVRNYVDVNSMFNVGKNSIYIYLPKENFKRIQEIGLEKSYQDNLNYIKSIKKYNFIEIDNLKNINPNTPLLLIDNFVLSENEKYNLKEYIKNGGSIIFNFNVDKKFLKEITGLKNTGYIKREKGNIFYLVQKLLSPIQIPQAKRLDIVLYDSIPIFSGKTPFLEWSNWAINDGIYDKENNFLDNGAVWAGKYYKGNWLYFSFPLYAFSSVKTQQKEYKSLFISMLDYAYNRYSVVKYPYLDSDKMIFISEDTEFRFENLKSFSEVIKSFDINATAFCVGKLAEKHPKLVKEAAKYLEIASHSYSHTDLLNASSDKLDVEVRLNKILLQNLSHQKVIGFRPPREQTNKKLREALKEAGFKYVLEKNLGQLKPKFDENLMILPRIGTDDYAYLIQLDWNKKKIINRIVFEMNFITNLNAIYTLSTHTHLFSYKSNIEILKSALKEFNKTDIPMLSGGEIYQKIDKVKNIELKISKTEVNILVNIKNNNPENIKNFTFRVYGDIKKVSSDFVNIKANIIKKGDNFVDIQIENISKFAEFNLFLGLQ